MPKRNEIFDSEGRPVLDAREARFVELYVCGGHRQRANAYGAARGAGYSHSIAETWSSVWLRDSEKNPKPHIRVAIAERRAELAAQEGITPEWIKSEIAKLAKGAVVHGITAAGDPYIDLTDMTYDELLTIKDIQVEEYLEGRGEDAREVKKVKVGQYSRLEALRELAKIHGIGVTSKVVHSNDPENPMPGAVQYDLTLLTQDELKLFIKLAKKATPAPKQVERPE